MARYSVQPEKAAEARDLLRTVETGYWTIGIALGAILILASPWVATHWIHATALSHGTVQQALLLMGVLAIFQWPVSLYHGGLMGLHRQVTFNILRIVVITLNTGGAVLILWAGLSYRASVPVLADFGGAQPNLWSFRFCYGNTYPRFPAPVAV